MDVGQLVDCSQQQQQSTVRVRNSRRPFAALTADQRVGVLVAEGGAVARQRLFRQRQRRAVLLPAQKQQHPVSEYIHVEAREHTRAHNEKQSVF